MESTVDIYVYGKQDDPALRQELVSIANTFSCRPEMQEMINFFSSTENIQGIVSAKQKYGMPPRNRPATKSGRLFGRWTDYCDWYDIYRFYYYAKISKEYPTLNTANKEICYPISGYIKNLREEKAIIEKEYTLHADVEKYKLELEAFNDKLTEYNLVDNNLQCEQYKKDQEELKSNLYKELQRKKSLEQQQQAFKETATTSGGGTKLAIYIFGGVAALIGIMVLTRKNA